MGLPIPMDNFSLIFTRPVPILGILADFKFKNNAWLTVGYLELQGCRASLDASIQSQSGLLQVLCESSEPDEYRKEIEVHKAFFS